MYGYVIHSKQAAIRVRTGTPDYSDFPAQTHDWEYTVYGKVCKDVPHDAPEPLGNHVLLSTHVDTNLYHDLVNGRALTAVLHLMNQTPFDWFCK